MRWGLALLRWAVGGLFIAHGVQKLFGWFGGPGLQTTAESFEQLQMTPGKRNALAAGVSELGGGVALVLGVATPLATTALTSTMVTAIEKVHRRNGYFAASGGYEFNLLLIATLAAIADEGPGALSLGRSEGGGAKAAAFTLMAGTAGALLVMEMGKREAAKLAGDEPAQSNGGAPDPAPEPASAPA